MTDTTSHVEEQLILMRAEARKADAEAAKAAKEARWIPYQALLIAAISSVPMWAGIGAVAIFATKWIR